MLPWEGGELIPLTLADWDVDAGTICLVVQGVRASSIEIDKMAIGDSFAGIAGPLGRPSEITPYATDQTVVFNSGGLGLPPAYPIMPEHLRAGNHITLIAGFRSAGLLFWTGEEERVAALQREYGDRLDVLYTTNDGTFGIEFLTTSWESIPTKRTRPSLSPDSVSTTTWPGVAICTSMTFQPFPWRGSKGMLGFSWIARATKPGASCCRQIHLESGVGADWTAAHRLYFN